MGLGGEATFLRSGWGYGLSYIRSIHTYVYISNPVSLKLEPWPARILRTTARPGPENSFIQESQYHLMSD